MPPHKTPTGARGYHMLRIEIKAEIQWLFQKTERGNWLADCALLGLTIQSASPAELAEDISDALGLLFRDLLSSNELDSFLRSHGWSRTRVELPTEPSEVEFEVPFELLAAANVGSSARLHQ